MRTPRPSASRLALIALLLLGATPALAACSDNEAEPASPVATSATPSESAGATESPSPSETGAPAGPKVGPAPAADVAACKNAIKKQFDMASKQQDPGGMPAECAALTQEQLTAVISAMMGGQG